MPRIVSETGDHHGIVVTCQTEGTVVGSDRNRAEDGQMGPDSIDYMLTLAHAHEADYPSHAVILTLTRPNGANG